MQRFEVAPWATSLKVVSALGTLVLVGAAFILFRAIPRGTRVPFAETFGTILPAVPLLTLFFALLFVVNGYELDTSGLRVQRLLWSTRLSLAGLDRAWHDPSVMCRSLRLFGNGGLFSVTGLFQNATLGRYRAFVTDPKQAVILHFPSRVVVLSPRYPHAFVGHLHTLIPNLAEGGPGSAA